MIQRSQFFPYQHSHSKIRCSADHISWIAAPQWIYPSCTCVFSSGRALWLVVPPFLKSQIQVVYKGEEVKVYLLLRYSSTSSHALSEPKFMGSLLDIRQNSSCPINFVADILLTIVSACLFLFPLIRAYPGTQISVELPQSWCVLTHPRLTLT